MSTNSNAVNLDAMLEKRREVLGGDGNKFEVVFATKSWWFVAPDLANSDWSDRFEDYVTDLRDGVITRAEAREELLDLLLEDSKADFEAACDKAGVDAFAVANMALGDYQERAAKNRSRPNSQRTPKRAKRR